MSSRPLLGAMCGTWCLRVYRSQTKNDISSLREITSVAAVGWLQHVLERVSPGPLGRHFVLLPLFAGKTNPLDQAAGHRG